MNKHAISEETVLHVIGWKREGQTDGHDLLLEKKLNFVMKLFETLGRRKKISIFDFVELEKVGPFLGWK